MDDNKPLSNKTFRTNSYKPKNEDLKSPVKQCYYLEGKYFVIIDKSITQKLNFFDAKNTKLFFEQDVTEDGNIILRPFNIVR